jgi:hypothetical protein
MSRRKVRAALITAVVTMAPLLGAGTTAAQAGAGGVATGARLHPPRFSEPTEIDNRYFPMDPGTEFVYNGQIVDDNGDVVQHSVVFTVTGVTKMIHGVRTVVAWDRDFTDGELQEAELAFFAQDDRGNVWNMGEYPEEFDNGRFAGAPSTWIDGFGGGRGGIHMLAHPRVGVSYVEGRVPAIEFFDVSKVTQTRARTCVPAGCFGHVLVVDETSPLDPTSGRQLKYYAPRVGLVRVGARGGDAREFLTLTRVVHLSRAKFASACAAVFAMDRRAYRVAPVYRHTPPARGCHRDD